MRRIVLLFLLIAVLPTSLQTTSARRRQSTAPAAITAATIPAPHEVLGFSPGDDRKLASWNQILSYFERLDKASNRVKFETLGKTTMGKPFVMATISAPENLANLEGYKAIQGMLADPRKVDAQVKAVRQRWLSGVEALMRAIQGPRPGDVVGPTSSGQYSKDLIKKGKTVVLITCGVHSTEVGSTLSSMLIAHRLASSDDPEVQEILRNTIVLLVPSLNPDGVDIVKNWYDKTLGTPYEGTDPPELYHKYVGHDNNRDWYAFTQVETQITVDKIHNVWRPHIVHDIHQQGAFGSRLFLPPYMPPVEPNVPKQIVEGYTELGNWMAGEMRKAGFEGITTNSTYDAWTPARAYSHYHGGVRILSETASARIATPITVKFEELRSREGYDPQKESDKFGPVWRGGEWCLSNITNYMTTAAFTLLKHAAQNREQWLRRSYQIGEDAVRPRNAGELSAFVIDSKGPGFPVLAQILRRGGVEVKYPAKAKAEGEDLPLFPAIVRMDQPYANFAKALLESQHYPDLRDQAGHPIAPYDVTSHTLPLLLGVKIKALNVPVIYSGKANAGFALPNCRSVLQRHALYRSAVPSMDEGWTRWILEHDGIQNCLGYSTLRDPDIRTGNLRAKFDTIIIPDQASRIILNGYRAGAMPPEYTGGLGPEGVKSLRDFVEEGGTLVLLNRASDFAIEQFKLPVRIVTAGLPRTDFYVPGSILRIELDISHPIAKGMPKESIAWAEDSPVFELVRGTGVAPGNRPNTGETPVPQARVIAWYPKERDPLLSGWLLGGDRIKGKAALVEVTLGKGRIVLFGFRPQYRAQSLATYPLLFNAMRLK